MYGSACNVSHIRAHYLRTVQWKHAHVWPFSRFSFFFLLPPSYPVLPIFWPHFIFCSVWTNLGDMQTHFRIISTNWSVRMISSHKSWLLFCATSNGLYTLMVIYSVQIVLMILDFVIARWALFRHMNFTTAYGSVWDWRWLTVRQILLVIHESALQLEPSNWCFALVRTLQQCAFTVAPWVRARPFHLEGACITTPPSAPVQLNQTWRQALLVVSTHW